MTLTDLPLSLREALATFEALRRLGIPTEEIFFQPGAGPCALLRVVVIRAGVAPFSVAIRNQGVTHAAFLQLWPRAVALWNGGASRAERRALYEASVVRRGGATALITALMSVGLVARAPEEMN